MAFSSRETTAPAPSHSLAGLDGAVIRPWTPLQKKLVHLLASLSMIASVAYIGWRVVATVSWSAWWVSVPFFVLEAHLVFRMILTVAELWDTDSGPTAEPVDEVPGRVAVLIATYNEGPEILLPTIAAALALAPEHETWVLDDGRRPEVEAMALELGARYLTRDDNRHAKAGNLNHALGIVEADFVAVLDADHVPERNFLRHTLGYFDDPGVALVQTPQEFYNGDSFIHQDGGSRHDEQFFHRVIMPGKNRCNAAFWCGTNAVLRVSALRWIGGVSTATITEDMHTTVRLHRTGWRTVHHNEVLARGLAPRNYAEFRTQRWRWGAGSMQSVAIENPLLSSGLSLGQRFMYGASALSWFDSWRTLGLHLIPPVVLLTGVAPVSASIKTLAAVLVVVHGLQLVTSRILSRGRLRLGSTLIFELLKMPANVSSSLVYLRPRKLSFAVTPKGRTGDGRQRHTVPTLFWLLLGLDVAAWLWATLSLAGLTPYQPARPDLVIAGVAWLLMNTVMLSLAIDRVRRNRYSSERRAGHRVRVVAPARVNRQAAQLEDVSLVGASIISKGCDDIEVGDVVRVDMKVGDQVASLEAHVRQRASTNMAGVSRLGVEYLPGQWGDRACLATGLFNEGMTSELVPAP